MFWDFFLSLIPYFHNYHYFKGIYLYLSLYFKAIGKFKCINLKHRYLSTLLTVAKMKLTMHVEHCFTGLPVRIFSYGNIYAPDVCLGQNLNRGVAG